MVEDMKNQSAKDGAEKPDVMYFKCKYCEEKKPLDDLVVMRQFYPPIAVCKKCAKAKRTAK